ncbi:tyrosine-type recombinase/integrase [Phytomonospora endophytica]|uniref:Integrase n=1 Tax=Phytomonospora endophytica TaxID=714109 RepID=A0A841FSH9_9ACTN|nr:site-specific integrase [Phytomonospora endophytica]MBB6037763.1 integrase [Phytomonospora endophytica]GIG67707.1 hypothetical protein Pen01_40020 [Phytomonospora endophytica]
MGYSRKRYGKDGRPRYTAYFLDLQEKLRSAGTFATKKEADTAWQDEEAKLRRGRGSSLARRRTHFEDYVERWLPHHTMEATTRSGYTYSINANLLPYFGKMKLVEIQPSVIREWLTARKQAGMTAVTREYNLSILSSILSTAVIDEYLEINPCSAVKTDPVPTKVLNIVSPSQFDQFHAEIPELKWQLLTEVDLETGCRWGEIAELRPKDFNFEACTVTISRVVVEIPKKFHPEGKRFLVKHYPKDKEFRSFKVSKRLCKRVQRFIKDENIAPDDLLFEYVPKAKSTPPAAPPQGQDLGLTEPNTKGRQYQHGTISAYGNAPCRCDHCRHAVAVYRANRRAAGKDEPRAPRVCDTDGHVPHRWFRDQIIRKALADSGLNRDITMHDLRRAHASWLLAGGADLQVVKKRLGHANITTTEKYLGTFDEQDDGALDAFQNIRQRSTKVKKKTKKKVGLADRTANDPRRDLLRRGPFAPTRLREPSGAPAREL